MASRRDHHADLDLDLGSDANVQDPFPLYAWLRDHDPVHWCERLGGFVVTRYEDVLAVFDRSEVFSAERFRRPGETPLSLVARVLSEWLVFRDPPDHTRLRGLLQKSFTPRQLEKNRCGIQKTIDDLLDRVLDRGEMDFIRDFAFPLPAIVIAILLGAPPRDIESIKAWSDRLAVYLGGSVAGQDNVAEASAGVAALVDYFRDLCAERRRRSRDDLVSLMLEAEHEGDRLSAEEVVSNCVLLLFAGHETTTNLLGNGLLHLLRHPDQEAWLRAHPQGVDSAVEELLRYDGPVPATAKIATREVEWHGAKIRRGDRVLPFMSSANRDPSRFECPEALDLGRRPNRHLAFGFGIHFCLGAPLARLESRLAFGTLLRGFPELAVVGTPRFEPQIFLRGLESLPLRFAGNGAG